VAEEITIVEVSGETFIKIALEEAVSRVVDLIINIIYYYYSLNKRSTIYRKPRCWLTKYTLNKRKQVYNKFN
jgi:hypothetical protein